MNRIIETADTVFNFLFGKMGKKTRKTIEKYGSIPIMKLEIKRTPITSAVNTLMNIITLGRFSKAKSRLQYDQLFHLQLVATLENNVKIVIEKNEIINVEPFQGDSKQTQTLVVNTYEPKAESVKSLLDKTLKGVGDNRFYNYDAFSQNCQLFILDILHVNRLLNSIMKTFILQDVGKLISQLPVYTSLLSKLSTRLAAYVQKVVQSFRYKKGGKVRMIKRIERRRRDYRLDGGKVNAENPNGHEMQNRDTIPALLVVGELVIPKKHVPLVEKFLKSQNILLPGMEK